MQKKRIENKIMQIKRTIYLKTTVDINFKYKQNKEERPANIIFILNVLSENGISLSERHYILWRKKFPFHKNDVLQNKAVILCAKIA